MNNSSHHHDEPERGCTASEQVAADLRTRVLTGAWATARRLPTVDALCRVYPFSRMTIAKAIRRLTDCGLLEPRGRAGVWIRRPRDEARIGILTNYGFGTPQRAGFPCRLTDCVRRELAARGQDVALFTESPEEEWLREGVPSPQLCEALARRELAGLITVASNLPEWLRRFPDKTPHVPVVDISWHPSRFRAYIDFAAAVKTAVGLMRAAGRRAVGLIGCPHPALPQCLRSAATRAGLRPLPDWLDATPCPAAEATGYERLGALWATSRQHPDALLVLDDVLAKGVCQAALRLGIRVPEELQILALVNEGIDLFYPCPVTRLVLPLPTLAGTAVTLLETLLRTPQTAPAEHLVAPVPATDIHAPAAPAILEVAHA